MPRFRLALAAAAGVTLGLALYASTIVVPWHDLAHRDDPLLAEDVARLAPARVARAPVVSSVEEIRAILREAAEQGLHVSIAGSRHSQGGQTYAEGGIRLDMRGFNDVRDVDADALTVTVESGATWDEVQRAIAPEGLAVKVMQSSNIFTVGGTLSANAHGRDLDVTQVVEVVERFSLMLADGRVLEVSRDENRELFSLVIGGYGLYGVILDVTLRVTRDRLFEQSAVTLDYGEFPAYFADRVRTDPGVAFMLARPSIDPDPDSFLRELVVVTWRHAGDAGPAGTAAAEHEGDDLFELTEERNVWRDRLIFGLSRRFDWAKSLRWGLQKRFELGTGETRVMSRNNAMRPPLAPLRFLEYRSPRDTDIIQEYYVPVENFVPFMDRFREILLDGGLNVLSATVRYVTPDPTPVLAYAPDRDVFAIIHMSNVGLSERARSHIETVTRELVDAAIEHGGSYYLTYQLYPTPEQLHRAYPRASEAFERKRYHDPDELFSNRFWERYGHTRPR